MQASPDYRKFAILYVDDEEKSLKSFSRAFGETFRVFTAANAKTGLQILEEHHREIGILMSDQRMPGEKGVWLLERARKLQPRLLRMLVTAYTDMEAAIEAVNSGSIYKYITKPWDPVVLEQSLKRGLEFFEVQWERDQLLQEKMAVLQNMMVTDRIVSLGVMAAGLSHHIRNALVAVKTFLDLAPAKMQDEKANPAALRHPEFWKDYHENVQGQIQKITNMLKQLGAASETATFELGEEVQLEAVIASAIATLDVPAKKSGIQVLNNVSAPLPPIKVDKARFSRLFEFLLRDELVSLPAGSTVSFSATVISGASSADSEIEVQIRDDGPGLSKETLRLLFDPFSVRSESPMEYGINLMACYFIIHHHGGKISAESEAGKGTVFTIRLPLNRRVAPSQEGPEFLQKMLANQTLWEKLATQ